MSNIGTKQYEYTVRDTKGRIVKGRLEAANEAAVVGRLRTMGLAPMSIDEVKTSGLQQEISFGEGKVGLKDLAVMSRQFATMVSAGLSLLRALNILADQTENKKLATTLGQVRNDVETGGSLSSAMRKFPDVFPPLMANIIRAGETGGFLEKALLSVASNYEAEVKLRAKIKSAMTYPVVVLFMAILAVIGMLLFIVPVFEKMFDGLGGTLPAPTLFLVWLSGVMKWLAPVLVVAAIVFMVWWNKNKNSDAVRSKVDPAKIKMPVFGSLFQKVAIARFTRNFATMLGAGVPILQALDIVGETSGNWVIEKAIEDVQSSVRNGHALSKPLAQHPVFPPMVVQMMAVGEDSGAMETMLHKVAEFYDQEVEAATEQLTALIEPLMIAFLGVVIGGMIVALYMPIFSIFELMG
ncbi:type II secretion system F family protein [Sanguibacter sp. A247]|uniref:type II secretion system F family protein n=1 Tax=unclassified Sanguibacter TaxID=2645534 RepID=UPI003FD7CEDF